MGAYISVRGWLQCDEQQLAAIQGVIAAHDDGGWGTPRRHVNWIHYVFYGADIRASAAEWLLAQLREIAAIPASDSDGDRVTGLFFASHEETGMSEWQVRDGQVHLAPGHDRYRYLDD